MQEVSAFRGSEGWLVATDEGIVVIRTTSELDTLGWHIGGPVGVWIAREIARSRAANKASVLANDPSLTSLEETPTQQSFVVSKLPERLTGHAAWPRSIDRNAMAAVLPRHAVRGVYLSKWRGVAVFDVDGERAFWVTVRRRQIAQLHEILARLGYPLLERSPRLSAAKGSEQFSIPGRRLIALVALGLGLGMAGAFFLSQVGRAWPERRVILEDLCHRHRKDCLTASDVECENVVSTQFSLCLQVNPESLHFLPASTDRWVQELRDCTESGVLRVFAKRGKVKPECLDEDEAGD